MGGSGSCKARAVIDGWQAEVVTRRAAYDIDAIAANGLEPFGLAEALPLNCLVPTLDHRVSGAQG